MLVLLLCHVHPCWSRDIQVRSWQTRCLNLAQVSEQELVQALEAAVTCCILAAAGPQRSRVLANLYKDERTRTLPVFPFLEKVYLERILRREEVCVACVECEVCVVCVEVCMCLVGALLLLLRYCVR